MIRIFELRAQEIYVDTFSVVMGANWAIDAMAVFPSSCNLPSYRSSSLRKISKGVLEKRDVIQTQKNNLEAVPLETDLQEVP